MKGEIVDTNMEQGAAKVPELSESIDDIYEKTSIMQERIANNELTRFLIKVTWIAILIAVLMLIFMSYV